MKYLPVPNLLAFSFPLIAFLGYWLAEPWLFIGVAAGWLVLMQLLDRVAGRDPKFPWKEVKANLKAPDTSFPTENVIMYVYVLVHLGVVGLGVWQFRSASDPLPWVLYAVPVALSGVNVLTIAHELLHGSIRLDIIVGRLAAIPAFWSVHEYEHLHLHHRDEIICTDEDTSYAKLGQSFYSYFFKGLIANYVHAWALQAKILEARKTKLIALRIIAGTYLPSVLVAVLVAVFFGPWALAFFMLQAFLSVLLFLLGTYNQHYGLTRRRMPDGSYEAFTYMNTWSADQHLTNWCFWNLGRHAHHHLDAFCSYTDLKIIEKSPLLPHGYFTTLAMSLIPPLWFRVMNPRVKDVLSRRDQLQAQGAL